MEDRHRSFPRGNLVFVWFVICYLSDLLLALTNLKLDTHVKRGQNDKKLLTVSSRILHSWYGTCTSPPYSKVQNQNRKKSEFLI